MPRPAKKSNKSAVKQETKKPDAQSQVFKFFASNNLHILLNEGLKEAVLNFTNDQTRDTRFNFIEQLVKNEHFNEHRDTLDEYLEEEIKAGMELVELLKAAHEEKYLKHVATHPNCKCKIENVSVDWSAVNQADEELQQLNKGMAFVAENEESVNDPELAKLVKKTENELAELIKKILAEQKKNEKNEDSDSSSPTK